MTPHPYVLPDLAYDYDALEPHLSARIVELHHDKHHAAYVAGANSALEQLAEMRGKGDFALIAMLEKNLAFNLSGHILHSLLWTNLSPHGGGRPGGALGALIDDTFGGLPALRQQMTEAVTTIQGSGWSVLSWEPTAARLMVHQVDDHQGNHGQGTVPLLAIDAWEHAFYLQYENRKADYVDAVWELVDWTDVARRLDAARAAMTSRS